MKPALFFFHRQLFANSHSLSDSSTFKAIAKSYEQCPFAQSLAICIIEELQSHHLYKGWDCWFVVFLVAFLCHKVTKRI